MSDVNVSEMKRICSGLVDFHKWNEKNEEENEKKFFHFIFIFLLLKNVENLGDIQNKFPSVPRYDAGDADDDDGDVDVVCDWGENENHIVLLR